MGMRRLGVYGENLPTKKERSVTPADFTIAGLYGSFNRKYNRTFRFRSAQEAALVLGGQTNPAWYGWDSLNGFFANLQGQSGSVIVASYLGKGATQATGELGIETTPTLDTVATATSAITVTPIYKTLATVAADSTGAQVTVDDTADFAVNMDVRIASINYVVVSVDSLTEVTLDKPVTVTAGDLIQAQTGSTNNLSVDSTTGLTVGMNLMINGDANANVSIMSVVSSTAVTVNLDTGISVGDKLQVEVGDAAFVPMFDLGAAYEDEPEYGSSANRTGFTLTKGSAFSTTVNATDGQEVTLDSIAGVRVGDTLFSGSEYHTVTDLNESTYQVTLEATPTWGVSDEVGVLAYQLKTFLRSTKGAVEEVQTTLGRTWVTTNVNDPDRYIVNVVNPRSAYLQVSSVANVPLSGLDETADVTYLTGGTDGTRQSSVTDFEALWGMMDNQPIRMVAAIETANPDVQKSLESYCRGREDNPIVMIVGQMDMTSKSQLIAAGQSLQRSNEVDAVYVHNWLSVADPFASSNMVQRVVPNAGHLMGQWISSIGAHGIHSIPARKDMPLVGLSGIIGYQAVNDFDRTDLAEAGVNVIQQLTGRGFIVRNHFTPSTAEEFRFSNGVIQRNFIKASVVDSLQTSENLPNTFNGVSQDRMTILQFMIKLWNKGSNGSVPVGDTFGQFVKADGSQSSMADAFEVIGNATNNDVGTLQRGERNFDIYFMFPAPAGSIRIGVGLLYRVS